MSGISVWLERHLKQRGLTLNAAAVYSGVSSATLSDMMNKGHIPKVELLFKLADYFDTPRNKVLELAGYLEPAGGNNTIDPALQAIADQLIEIWYDVREMDPESAERLTRIAVLQAEMVLAAARNREKHEDKEGEGTTIINRP